MSVAGAAVTASLSSSAAGAPALNLTLRAYAGGVVRILVDEPGAGRYQVPDILLPDLEARAAAWEAAPAGKSSWTGSTGGTAVTLSFAPFRLSVAVGGAEAVTLNSRNLFAFEHRRSKTVGFWVVGGGLWSDLEPVGCIGSSCWWIWSVAACA